MRRGPQRVGLMVSDLVCSNGALLELSGRDVFERLSGLEFFGVDWWFKLLHF